MSSIFLLLIRLSCYFLNISIEFVPDNWDEEFTSTKLIFPPDDMANIKIRRGIVYHRILFWYLIIENPSTIDHYHCIEKEKKEFNIISLLFSSTSFSNKNKNFFPGHTFLAIRKVVTCSCIHDGVCKYSIQTAK